MLGRKHIVIVDDDRHIRAAVQEYLELNDLRVTALADAAALASVLDGGLVDLVLLDLGLPDADGLALVRSLRTDRAVPVIVVSGRGEMVDRVVGLEMGADDYLAKPFALRELLARIRAVLRRAGGGVEEDAAPGRRAQGHVRFAGWELALRSRSLKDPAGREVHLTRAEFGLLATFLDHPNRVLTREQLLAMLRVHAEDVFDRSIDVQILRLRRKIEPDPRMPSLIMTERGVGYRFAAAVERR